VRRILKAVPELRRLRLSSIDSIEADPELLRAIAEHAIRDDDRAVWLYLVARDPERQDDPDVVAFVDFLNSRLPELECNGKESIPVPVEEE